MGRASVLNQKGYEHKDFAELLKELNKENEIAKENIVEKANNNQSDVIIQESEARHRMMSNEKIKFICSSVDGMIHDKRCKCAKSIPDEEIEWLEEYEEKWMPCPQCMIRAYILAGAYDPKEYLKYEEFFAKIKITAEQIRSIYIEKRMKTRIYPDALTIWYQEDAWRIKALPKKGHVQLLHNNYIVRKKGIREFTQRFHIQNTACEDTNITYALGLIMNYSYHPEESALHNSNRKRHLKNKEWQKTDSKAVSLEDMLESTKLSINNTLWERIKYCVKYLLGQDNLQKIDFFDTYDFHRVDDYGYPEHQTICIYIWKDKQGNFLWQNGIYNQKLKQFSVSYGATVYVIRQSKVVAWKKMSVEALKLDVGEV